MYHVHVSILLQRIAKSACTKEVNCILKLIEACTSCKRETPNNYSWELRAKLRERGKGRRMC